MVKVNSNLMTAEAEEQAAIASQIETISDAISNVNSNMKWNVSGSSAVRSKLQSYSNNLSTMSQSLSALSVVLVDSASAYENVENELCSTESGSGWSNIETLIASGKFSSDVSSAVAALASTNVATDIAVQGASYDRSTALALAMALATESGTTDTGSTGLIDALSSFIDRFVDSMFGKENGPFKEVEQFIEMLKEAITRLTVQQTGGLTSSEATSAENAEKAGLTYYSNKKTNENYSTWWGTQSGDSGCALTCAAMIFSYFGYTQEDYYPGNLKIKNNGGNETSTNANVSWDTIEAGTDINFSNYRSLDGYSEEKLEELLENQLYNYINDPENEAPPIISFYLPDGGTHFVIVVGKDESGNYIIVDPSTTNRTTLKIGSSRDATSGYYVITGLRSVVTCQKE